MSFLAGGPNLGQDRPDANSPDRADRWRADRIRRIAAALDRLEDIARLIWRYFSSTQQAERATEARIGDILTEITGQVEDRLDELERTTTLSLAILQSLQSDRARRASGPLTSVPIDKRKASLRRQLQNHYETLNEFEERAAAQGPFPTIETVNAIKITRSQIEEIEIELRFFENL